MSTAPARRKFVRAGLAIGAVLLAIGLYANRLHEDATGVAGWTAYEPGHLPPDVRHPGFFGYYAGRWWIVAGVVVALVGLAALAHRAPPRRRPTLGRAAWTWPELPSWRALSVLGLSVALLIMGIVADHHRSPGGACRVMREQGTLDEASPELKVLCAEPAAWISRASERWWVLAAVGVVLAYATVTTLRRSRGG